MTCPDANLVQGLIMGRLGAGERELMQAHVDGCATCHQLVLAFATSSGPAGSPVAPPPVAPPPIASAPEMPVRVERYQVRDRLGQGGMGVVYLAYDPELHREIALKLLSPMAAQGDSVLATRARLLREAQAMARVSHPNVIAVYDVGTFESQVFVAMELASNGTLRRWQRGRTWRELLAAYGAAGRGLAAAHTAGIVHRDFKPDNVLIGADGRIRVTDFGLARAACAYAGAPLSGLLDAALTATGMVIGTPAYMAPEQIDGVSTDARTDQFSFCVALWEALFGVRPFAGMGLHEVRAAIAARAIAPGKNPGVPPRVVAALSRGLAEVPAARWPSMGALLDELEGAPRSRRRAQVALVAAATGVVFAGLAIASGPGGPGGHDPTIAPDPPPAASAAVPAGAGSPAGPERAVPQGCIKQLAQSAVPPGDLMLTKACGAVTLDGEVTIDATLTIEPGVVLVFKEDAALYVGRNERGRLLARGTRDAPIVFTTASEPTPGIWDGVHLPPRASGSVLTWVQIRYAGSRKQSAANQASLAIDADRVTLDHVTIADGAGFGVVALSNEPSFAQPISGCVFRALARGALQLQPVQLAGLASDNTMDETGVIEVLGGEIHQDTHFHAGKRYRLMADVSVERTAADPATPTLTIEAGATIEGTSGSSLYVGRGMTGTLKALGAPGRPVRFTSVDRKKGTWGGIHFREQARDSTIAGAVVEFAGSSDGEAAIQIDDGAEVALRNVAFAHLEVGVSAHDGPRVTLAGLTGDDVADVQRLTR